MSSSSRFRVRSKLTRFQRMSSHSLLVFLVSVFCFHFSMAARPVTAPVDDQPLTMRYHKGALLTGSISVNFIWYGKFTATQRAILTDFVTSLSSPGKPTVEPSVATWWKTVGEYYKQSKARFPKLTLGDQILDEECSLGKSLSDDDIETLAAKGSPRNAVNVVLTSADVVVRGFCMSRCGTHGASKRTKSGRFAYVWVGNPVTQCPGECSWPFHQPVYGPQSAPLVAPNGDVGVDGMVINFARTFAGAVTNPFGNGFFQGPKEAPLEAASACPGVYGSGAYPGYAGALLVDPVSGASYNANGAHGRKYLLPALMNPATSQCFTLV